MNAKGALIVADVSNNTVRQSLSAVDARNADQPFRPAAIILQGQNTAFVAHQALDRQYQPTGGGALYVAKKTNSPGFAKGFWELNQQIPLQVTNPGYMESVSPNEVLVTGVCYLGASEKCIAGVDIVDVSTLASRHVSQWDSSKWIANGDFFPDIFADSLIACVRTNEGADAKNMIVRYKRQSGQVAVIKELAGPGCGGVVADAAQQRLIIGEPTFAGGGLITVLDSFNNEIARSTLDGPVLGLTAIFD